MVIHYFVDDSHYMLMYHMQTTRGFFAQRYLQNLLQQKAFAVVYTLVYVLCLYLLCR